jgi:hypothetical protein
MDFEKILRSVEELLFEAVSWLFFYPRTMAQIVRRPLQYMAYAEAETRKPQDERYDEAMSPPVLLLLTLLLVIGLGAAAHTPAAPTSSALTKVILATPQNTLLFRCLLFSLTPLVAALTLLRKQRWKITGEALRGPFYAQCCLAAPFALTVSAGGVAFERGEARWAAIGASVTLIAVLWLLTVETRWFAKRLGVGHLTAAGTAVWALLRAMAYLIAIAALAALI